MSVCLLVGFSLSLMRECALSDALSHLHLQIHARTHTHTHAHTHSLTQHGTNDLRSTDNWLHASDEKTSEL